MYTIFDIANWFLEKEEMNQKKVQKLCYYVQAWSIALFDNPIIDCEFEAWAHGPVCRNLWEKLRDYSYNNINKDVFKYISKPIDKNDTDFMERVWATYKDFSGYQLEVLTHKETPWINARGNTPEFQRCTNIISNSDMRDYYRAIYSGDGIGE